MATTRRIVRWTVGLRGQLSVEVLDERWGSRSHHGPEFQFYSRRKVIIDEIKRPIIAMAGGRETIDRLRTSVRSPTPP